MTDNVIGFNPKKEKCECGTCGGETYVRACASCGCSTFIVTLGGEASCANCRQAMEDGEAWFDPREAVPGAKINADANMQTVIDMGDPRLALKGLLDKTYAKRETLVVVVAAHSDGLVNYWGTADLTEGEGRLKWLRDRMEAVIQMEKSHVDGSGLASEGGGQDQG